MKTETWKPLIAAYQKPSAARASWQILNSVGVYIALWCAMALALSVSWWLAIPLAVLAGAVLVRVFIIFHDCGHGSFFASRTANDRWGFVTGVLTFTPYAHWRWQHAIHHGSTGNLDRRGVGDIWTMTVREYQQAPWWKRMAYRVARNPIVLLGIAPLVMFLLEQRLPSSRAGARERHSVWWTNLCLLGMAVGMSAIFGFLPYLILQLTILAVAGGIGVWLFYSQHQFEGAYWARGDDWSYADAALQGQRVPQAAPGPAVVHRQHRLPPHPSPQLPHPELQPPGLPRVPPLFEQVTPMTVFRSIRAFSLKLWDEASGKLVGFRQLRLARQREYAWRAR